MVCFRIYLVTVIFLNAEFIFRVPPACPDFYSIKYISIRLITLFRSKEKYLINNRIFHANIDNSIIHGPMQGHHIEF